jgi:uncharacterized membrane protein
MRALLDCVTVILVALVAGTTFGILAGYDPSGISGPAYIEVQQGAIRGLNVLIPVMGGVAIVLTLIDAWVSRGDKARMTLLLVAAAFLVLAALVTRLGNQPINAIVATWNAQTPPAGWETLRDQWWYWHVIRTWITIAALLCLLIGTKMGRAGLIDRR